MALTVRRARRQRTVRLARLRGRAVHAADGHHLRAAGVRAGAGVSVGGADRTRPAARPGEPPACRGQRHAVAGARPRRGPAAVDRAAQPRTGGGQHVARLTVAAACRAADAGGARDRRPRYAAFGTRPAGAAAGRCRIAGTFDCGPNGAIAAGPRGVRRPHRRGEAGDRDGGDAACRDAPSAWRHHEPARRCSGAACRDAATDRRTRQDGAGEQGHHRRQGVGSGEGDRPVGRRPGATRRDAAADRRTRQDGADRQGHHRRQGVRSRQAGRAEPGTRRAARCAGEAGTGRRGAIGDRPAAPCRGRDGARRGEAARQLGARADRPAQSAGGRTEGAAHVGREVARSGADARGSRRTRRSPISARS